MKRSSISTIENPQKMNKRKIFALVCLLLTTLTLCCCDGVWKAMQEAQNNKSGRTESWDDSYGTVMKDLRYGQRTNETYDLTIPKGTVKNGLLLFIHGGSWMGGDKQWMEYACRRYAKQGYVTASMNYAFINGKGSDRGTMPMMDQEVVSCLKSIVSTLGKRGIKVSNLAVGGHSAGAQIAATYAMKHVKDSPVPLRFAIIESGPLALSQMFSVDETKLAKIRQGLKEGKTNISGKQDVDNLVMNAAGVEMKPDMYYKNKVDALVNSSSAVSLVTSSSVPIIMAYGAKDWLVKPLHYQAMERAYKQYSRPYTLIVYPNSGHELDGDPDKTQLLQQTVKDYLRHYFR